MHWYYTPVGNCSKRLIYTGKKFLDEFEDISYINKTTPGQYDLSFDNVRFSDAGTYTCEIVEERTLQDVELVVLGEEKNQLNVILA